MARHERDIQAAAEKPLSLDEIVALIGAEGDLDSRERDIAIACYLSAGEGWREAKQRIGGAFAEGGSGLKERKSD